MNKKEETIEESPKEILARQRRDINEMNSFKILFHLIKRDRVVILVITNLITLAYIVFHAH